nr:uncharacterized protein LOC113839892 isoform X1 [Anas platyrhynchos]
MCSLPGVLLLLLTGATSAEEPWIQQSPAKLWLSPGMMAELSCSISDSPERANWYREKPDGSLEWIYWSTAASKPKGKYSGTVRAPGIFSLSISNVQREDSGYYYCTSSVLLSQFGKGTRLLVTDASEPKLSILVPVDAEEPSDFVSLLCHLPGAWNLTWVSGERWDGAMNCTATERGTGRIVSETIGTAGCFLWLLAFVPPGAAVLALMWWAARLRRRPARAVLRRGPEVSCFPSPRHEAVGTAGGRSSQAARPGALARAKHPLQLQAQPQARGFSLSLAARVRVRGAGALRSPFPAPALPEAAHACGLRAAKTREERESGGILRSAAFPCWAAWQRGRRNAESAAGSSIAMRDPMQIIKLLYATEVSQLHWDRSLCYPV